MKSENKFSENFSPGRMQPGKKIFALGVIFFVFTLSSAHGVEDVKGILESVFKNMTENILYETVTFFEDSGEVPVTSRVYFRDKLTFRIEMESRLLGKLVTVTTPQGTFTFDPATGLSLEIPRQTLPVKTGAEENFSAVLKNASENEIVVESVTGDGGKVVYYIDRKNRVFKKIECFDSNGKFLSGTEYRNFVKKSPDRSLFERPPHLKPFRELEVHEKLGADEMAKLGKESGVSVEDEGLLSENDNYEEVFNALKPAVEATKRALLEENTECDGDNESGEK